MSEYISPNDFVEVMLESFERGQELIFTPSGTSMLPMLDGRSDKVTFSAKPDHLKKFDVAFYKRPDSGQLVLHRMIGFTKSGDYIFCGDNQYDYEYGIRDKDILALMVSFTHKGKVCYPNDLRYRIYVRCMMLRKRLRRFLGRVYRKLIKPFRNK